MKIIAGPKVYGSPTVLILLNRRETCASNLDSHVSRAFVIQIEYNKKESRPYY